MKKEIIENNKLLEENNLNKILKIYYNVDVLYTNNYEYYRDISKEVKYDILCDDFSNEIKSLHDFYVNKCEIRYDLRINRKTHKVIHNSIIKYMKNTNKLEKDKFKLLKIYNKQIKNILNMPEKHILSIIKDLYNSYDEIIFVAPQYKLEVKFKQQLIADFFLLLYVDNKLFPLIIEFDGKQHYYIDAYFFQIKQIKRDLVKNNFCIINNISLLRIKYDNQNLYEIINNTLLEIIKYKKCVIKIRKYDEYTELLNNK